MVPDPCTFFFLPTQTRPSLLLQSKQTCKYIILTPWSWHGPNWPWWGQVGKKTKPSRQRSHNLKIKSEMLVAWNKLWGSCCFCIFLLVGFCPLVALAQNPRVCKTKHVLWQRRSCLGRSAHTDCTNFLCPTSLATLMPGREVSVGPCWFYCLARLGGFWFSAWQFLC